MMSRNRVRRLFVLVLLGLVVQYALVGLIGWMDREPWPALVLPGFKTVYATNDTLEVVSPSLVAYSTAETAHPLSIPQFLDPLPRSHHAALFREQCRPAFLSGTPATERCLAPEAQRWFVDRADTLLPEATIQRVDVVWLRLRIAPNQLSTQAPATIPLGRLTLKRPSVPSNTHAL